MILLFFLNPFYPKLLVLFNYFTALDAMFTIANHKGLEEDTRESAIEVLITFAEAKPVMMKYFIFILIILFLSFS